MKPKLLLCLALVACNSRTELMFGVATDLRAPDAIDTVQLDITRVKDGFLEQQLVWDISGHVNQPFNLPGSYGVNSDGEEIQLDVVLTGLKNNQSIVSRRSVVSLVSGQTLFYRIGLTAGCIDRADCPATSSCVEGVCRDVNVPSIQLPDFDGLLVSQLSCAAGAVYIDTGTGDPMPLSADAAACPAGQCLEGTCLKPPPKESGTRTVRGSKITTFLEPNNKTTQVPTDVSALQVAAIVIDSGGAPSVFPGAGNADGTFSIPDVPKGSYTLQVGTDFTVTSADNVDLGNVELGRPGRKAAVDPTNTGLAFNVTGMAPWADGNRLTAYAPIANDWWFFFDETMATPPTVGQTTLATNLSFDDPASSAADLIAKDEFALIQYTNKTASDGTTIYQAPTKILKSSSITMTEGQFAPVVGAFVDIPQTETMTLDVRQLEWENAVGWNGTNATLLNPAAVPVQFTNPGVDVAAPAVGMDLLGQPGGANYGSFSATLDYFFIEAPPGQNVTFSNISFGKPDIGGYTYAQVLFAGTGFRVPYQLPGTNNPTNLFFTLSNQRAATSTTLTVTPTLGPVRNPQIDGSDLLRDAQTLSPTPTITWSAPAIGSATQYTLRFTKLTVNMNNNTAKTVVATVHTTDTKLVVPPNILEPGAAYFVVIIASDDGNIDAPLRARFPSSFAPTASGIFTVTAGSGRPDAGPVMTDSGSGTCNPLTQTGCGGGFACYSNATGAICSPPGSTPLGSTCTMNGNCVQGAGCAGTCRAYCNFNQFPNMQGTCPAGQTCGSFNPDAGLCQ